MTIKRSHLILGATILAVALAATVARTHALQDWYDTITVQGTITAYLLDDRAAVNGLLLEGGSQVHLSPRFGVAIASRIKTGDRVSVVGRGGRATSLGRLVDAKAITVNGQTVTFAGEPDGPRGGPRGRGGRGPADGPDRPRDGRGEPLARDGRGTMNAPPAAEADARPAIGLRDVAAPPASGDQAPPPDAPAPPVLAEPVTLHGTVSTFLVGPRGEVRGLVLNTGEQVQFSPRVGEALAPQREARPQATVVGEVVRSDYGIIVRAAQLTVGSQTVLVH